MERKLTHEELVDLVRKIFAGNGTEEEISNLLDVLKKNVPHPSPGNLIYWEDLTPEEVVDKCLAYKPIQL